MRSMTTDQREGFLRLHQNICDMKDGSLTLLDSKPGTGKTHLMGLFTLSLVRHEYLHTLFFFNVFQ